MGDWKGGGVGEVAGYTFKTQAVLLHGWGYYLHVLHPGIAANANFNIECLHRTLLKFLTTSRPTQTSSGHLSSTSKLTELLTTNAGQCSCMANTWFAQDCSML